MINIKFKTRKATAENDWKLEPSGPSRLSRNDQSFVTCETEISTLMTLQESSDANEESESGLFESDSIKPTPISAQSSSNPPSSHHASTSSSSRYTSLYFEYQ